MRRFTVRLSLPIMVKVDARDEQEARQFAAEHSCGNVTPEEVSDAWMMWENDKAFAFDQCEVMDDEEIPSTWIVETLTIVDGWTNTWTDNCGQPDERPSTFKCKENAQEELIDMFASMQESDMDFDVGAYRVREVTGDDLPTASHDFDHRADIGRKLMAIEQTLDDMIMDAQDKAESTGLFTRGMKSDDGSGICVPEDAAPELDSARTHIQEAIEDISNTDES